MFSIDIYKVSLIAILLSVICLDVAEHFLGMDHIEICMEEESDSKEDKTEKEFDHKLIGSELYRPKGLYTAAIHRYHYLSFDDDHSPSTPCPPPDGKA